MHSSSEGVSFKASGEEPFICGKGLASAAAVGEGGFTIEGSVARDHCFWEKYCERKDRLYPIPARGMKIAESMQPLANSL